MYDDLIDAVRSEFERYPETTSLTSPGYWEACRGAAEGLLELLPDFVVAHAEQRHRAGDAVEARWGAAFDGLTLHWLLCRSVALVADWDTARQKQGHDSVTRARRQVFWTAHHVAEEVLVLLRSGFPAGAQARWRAMCELELRLALLDLAHDAAVAEAYHDHAAIRQYNELEHEHAIRRAEGEEVEPEQRRRPAAARDALVLRYGREFMGDFGWAHTFLKAADKRYRNAACRGDRTRGPLFDDVVSYIEGAKETRAHIRHRYAWASAAVHGEPRLSADVDPGGELVPWTAPTIEGLAEGAVNLAVSLTRLTDRYAWWLPEDSAHNPDLLTGIIEQLAGLVIERIHRSA